MTYNEGDRLRIVGGDHDGRAGIVAKMYGELWVIIDAEPGESRPTEGRMYCRGGRGGFCARLADHEWAQV